MAQVSAASNAVLRQLPPGVTPPFLLTYNASSVPILQIGLGGKNLSEQQLNDFALNFIRTQLVTVPGAAVPYPYGGKQRQIMIDLSPQPAVEGAVAAGRRRRGQCSESDSAGRHRENRPVRI